MKKFLFLLVAILTATAVNAQLVYTKAGKLTFGNISFPDNSTATAWEGAGHYFRNGASSGGETWLKLDLSSAAPVFRSNSGVLTFSPAKFSNAWLKFDLSENNPAFVSGNGLFSYKSDSGNSSFTVDLTRSRPYLYSTSGRITFKYASTAQNLFAGGLYIESDSRTQGGAERLGNVLEDVVRLVPRRTQITDTSLRRGPAYGFWGQEIESVFPELVSQDVEGTKYVNSAQLLPILTRAVQELYLLTVQQAERIEQLERQLDPKMKH